MHYHDVSNWSSFLVKGATVEVVRDCGTLVLGSVFRRLDKRWAHVEFRVNPETVTSGVVEEVEREVVDESESRVLKVVVRFAEGVVTMHGHHATFLRPPADHPWWGQFRRDTAPKISTTLPTEPGNYLFCGSRDGHIHNAADLQRQRVELVRVFPDNADNRLRYIGSDVFYEPEKAVGAWLPYMEEAAALKKESAALLLDHAARILLPKVFGKHSSLHTTSVLRELAGYNKDADTQQAAQQVFDRAVALGVIVLTDYAYGWKLAETDKERP